MITLEAYRASIGRFNSRTCKKTDKSCALINKGEMTIITILAFIMTFFPVLVFSVPMLYVCILCDLICLHVRSNKELKSYTLSLSVQTNDNFLVKPRQLKTEEIHGLLQSSKPIMLKIGTYICNIFARLTHFREHMIHISYFSLCINVRVYVNEFAYYLMICMKYQGHDESVMNIMI